MSKQLLSDSRDNVNTEDIKPSNKITKLSPYLTRNNSSKNVNSTFSIVNDRVNARLSTKYNNKNYRDKVMSPFKCGVNKDLSRDKEL